MQKMLSERNKISAIGENQKMWEKRNKIDKP